MPLFAAGFALSLGCQALNYTLAPRAEAAKRAAIDNLRSARNKESREQIDGHLFRDRLHHRTWFVRRLRPNGSVLEGVQVLQQDEQGNILRKWYASKAIHDPATGRWTLQRGMIVELTLEGDVKPGGIDNFQDGGQRQIDGWYETPWRIASSRLDPLQLTTPELVEYLQQNADFTRTQLAPFVTAFWDRWALPWSCLVVVFLAAPLSIIYSRRGILTNVGAAILLFFFLLMSRSLFLALGRADRMPALVAAWGPLGALFLFGLFLLWMRTANRDVGSLLTRRRG
jgi:lipopolysaccharide export LptBFGC system permease protein LptF